MAERQVIRVHNETMLWISIFTGFMELIGFKSVQDRLECFPILKPNITHANENKPAT
jgi:hypothetical protein